MRAEGDLYATRARYNPVLDQALGIWTDFVPNHLALSPRFGFTWRRSAVDDGYAMGRFGNFRIPYASVVRGGIGAFRNLLGAPLVGQVLSSTGLPDAAQHISCGGSAVPAREWSGWLSGSVGLP